MSSPDRWFLTLTGLTLHLPGPKAGRTECGAEISCEAQDDQRHWKRCLRCRRARDKGEFAAVWQRAQRAKGAIDE